MFSKGNKRDYGSEGVSPVKPAVPSIVSTDMKIVGDLVSDGEIQVDGSVEGDIQSQHLLIGEPADVKGEITAEVVEIFGTVNGQIKATSVSLAKTAHVVGDILHENLSIEKGAFLEGHCKRMPEKKEPNERIALVRDASAPNSLPKAGDDNDNDKKATPST